MIYRLIFVTYLLHFSHATGGFDVCSGMLDRQSNRSYKTWYKMSEFSDVIVHLADWTYEQIKDECKLLSNLGYGAVQISPVTEHVKTFNPSWDERYSVTTYNINNDSGHERSLIDMIEKCNSLGISVFAEVVLNNMAKSTDKTKCGVPYSDKRYSECHKVPFYTEEDFHKGCPIQETDYISNVENVRTCELENRHDLKQVINGQPNREIIKFLDRLIHLGIAGFSILAADHMDPNDLLKIYDSLSDVTMLETEEHVPPFIYQDVYDLQHKTDVERVIKAVEYNKRTRVTDYKYAEEMSRSFLKRENALPYFINWGTQWNLQESDDSVVFINNYITDNYIDRGFSFPRSKWGFINTDDVDGFTAYKLATVFMLTHGHGIPLITSGFKFIKHEESVDGAGEITVKTSGKKFNNLHRIREIYSSVDFRRLAFSKNDGKFPSIEKFKEHSEYQITYCVGDIGFVVFNNFKDRIPFVAEVETCFKHPGIYCDVFGGTLNDNWEADKKPCTGNSIRVDKNGIGLLNMKAFEGAALFHINSMKMIDQ